MEAMIKKILSEDQFEFRKNIGTRKAIWREALGKEMKLFRK